MVRGVEGVGEYIVSVWNIVKIEFFWDCINEYLLYFKLLIISCYILNLI